MSQLGQKLEREGDDNYFLKSSLVHDCVIVTTITTISLHKLFLHKQYNSCHQILLNPLSFTQRMFLLQPSPDNFFYGHFKMADT